MTGWQLLLHETMTRHHTVHEIWLRYHYDTGWQKHTWQVQTAAGGRHTTTPHSTEAEARAHIDRHKQEWQGDWQPFTGKPRVLFGPGQRPVY